MRRDKVSLEEILIRAIVKVLEEDEELIRGGGKSGGA